MGEAAEDLCPLGDPATDVVGDRHALLGEPDGRSPQLGPRHAAPASPERLVEVERPGHGDGVDAVEGHRPEAAAGVVVPRGARGGHPAPVEPDERLALRVVHDGERVASEAAHHGEDDALGGGDGEGRVEGVAAALEDGEPDESGHGVGGGHHAPDTQRLGPLLGRATGRRLEAPGPVVHARREFTHRIDLTRPTSRSPATRPRRRAWPPA